MYNRCLSKCLTGLYDCRSVECLHRLVCFSDGIARKSMWHNHIIKRWRRQFHHFLRLDVVKNEEPKHAFLLENPVLSRTSPICWQLKDPEPTGVKWSGKTVPNRHLTYLCNYSLHLQLILDVSIAKKQNCLVGEERSFAIDNLFWK